jgi:glutamate-1-semialdehyde 2,1-aminomutase
MAIVRSPEGATARRRAIDGGLAARDIACFIVEPVMENIGICLPDPGYLEGVRDLTRQYGTMLLFDEVKTGITAGWSGAAGHFGVTPDLIVPGKSIGGRLPRAAFGGSEECMDAAVSGRVQHVGHRRRYFVFAARCVHQVLNTVVDPSRIDDDD